VFGISSGAQPLKAATLGGWAVSPAGTAAVQVTPPEGYQLPLVLTGVSLPGEVVIDPPTHEDSVDVKLVVPKATEITGVLTLKGVEVARERAIFEAGERTLAIRLDPDKLAGGRADYRITLNAFDGVDRVSSQASVVLVRPQSGLLMKAVIAAAIALAGFVFFRRRQIVRRRRLRRAD
jgi:hypothetical protein